MSKVSARAARTIAAAPLDLVESPALLQVLLRHGGTIAEYIFDRLRITGSATSAGEALGRLSRAKGDEGFASAAYALLFNETKLQPPWPGNTWIKPLMTLKEVRSEARRFRNCIADHEHIHRMMCGDLMLYVAEMQSGPVCTSLKHDRAFDRWRVSEMLAIANARVPRKTALLIEQEFARAGFPYLPRNPLAPWYDR